MFWGRSESTSQGRPLNVRLGRPPDVISGRLHDVRWGSPLDVSSQRPWGGQRESLGTLWGRWRGMSSGRPRDQYLAAGSKIMPSDF